MAEWIDRAGREDRPPPPPELVQWLKVKAWGDDVMGWPARTFVRMRLARNVYEAWQGYVGASNPVAWSKRPENAGAWQMVGEVKELRREAAAGDDVGRVERWKGWMGSGGDGEQGGEW